MNIFEQVYDLMQQGYENNPEVAEKLYKMYNEVSKEFVALKDDRSVKEAAPAGTPESTIVWVALCMKLMQWDDSTENTERKARIVMDYLKMDRKELRAEFDEEWVELIYHGRLDEGGY